MNLFFIMLPFALPLWLAVRNANSVYQVASNLLGAALAGISAGWCYFRFGRSSVASSAASIFDHDLLWVSVTLSAVLFGLTIVISIRLNKYWQACRYGSAFVVSHLMIFNAGPLQFLGLLLTLCVLYRLNRPLLRSFISRWKPRSNPHPANAPTLITSSAITTTYSLAFIVCPVCQMFRDPTSILWPFLDMPFQVSNVVTLSIAMVAAAYGCLSVWAALSPGPRFVRVSTVLGAWALLLLVRADEPLLLFSLTIPLTIILLRGMTELIRKRTSSAIHHPSGWHTLMICGSLTIAYQSLAVLELAPIGWYQWLLVLSLTGASLLSALEARGRRPLRCTSRPKAANWRFRVQDLFLATTVVAVSSAILSVPSWPATDFNAMSVVVSAIRLAVVITGAAAIVLSPGHQVAWLLIALVLATAEVPVTFRGARIGFHTAGPLLDWGGWREEIPILLIVTLVVMVLTQLMFRARVIRQCSIDDATRFEPSARAVCLLVTFVILLFGPLVVVYGRLLAYRTVKIADISEPNAWPQWLDVSNQLGILNPFPFSSLTEIRERDQDPVRALKVDEIYRASIELLQQPWEFPLDSFECNGMVSGTRLSPFMRLSNLAGCWSVEGAGAAEEGRFDDAIRYGIALVQWGNQVQSQLRWPTDDEQQGLALLSNIRHQIDPAQAIPLIAILDAIDRDRISDAESQTRIDALRAMATGWRYTFPMTCQAWLGKPARRSSASDGGSPEKTHRVRDAQLRLLITELAIGVFRRETGQLPMTLDELGPRIVPRRAMLDPLGEGLLKYRLDPDAGDYRLYSVGADGHDDSGHFDMHGKQELGREVGFDLDLEALLRRTQ